MDNCYSQVVVGDTSNKPTRRMDLHFMVVTYWIDLLLIWLCLIFTAYSNITSFSLVYDVDLVTVLCVLDDMDALIRYIRSVAIGLSWLIYITYSLLVTVKQKWYHLYSVSQGEMLLYVACAYWSRSVPWSEVFTVERKNKQKNPIWLVADDDIITGVRMRCCVLLICLFAAVLCFTSL